MKGKFEINNLKYNYTYSENKNLKLFFKSVTDTDWVRSIADDLRHIGYSTGDEEVDWDNDYIVISNVEKSDVKSVISYLKKSIKNSEPPKKEITGIYFNVATHDVSNFNKGECCFCHKDFSWNKPVVEYYNSNKINDLAFQDENHHFLIHVECLSKLIDKSIKTKKRKR